MSKGQDDVVDNKRSSRYGRCGKFQHIFLCFVSSFNDRYLIKTGNGASEGVLLTLEKSNLFAVLIAGLALRISYYASSTIFTCEHRRKTARNVCISS